MKIRVCVYVFARMCKYVCTCRYTQSWAVSIKAKNQFYILYNNIYIFIIFILIYILSIYTLCYKYI